MIDWLVIVSSAIGFMTAFVSKIGETVALKVGEEIFSIVKNKFKGDKEAKQVLSNFQKKPARYKDALIDVLKEKIQADISFGESLRIIVEKNQQSKSKIEQIAHGNGNVQVIGNNVTASSKVKTKE